MISSGFQSAWATEHVIYREMENFGRKFLTIGLHSPIMQAAEYDHEFVATSSWTSDKSWIMGRDTYWAFIEPTKSRPDDMTMEDQADDPVSFFPN